jgi:UDP-N-acetylmuramyl pentapeptide synthase
MRSMINMMMEMPVAHKWAVVGDMVEQGASEQEEHSKLGAILAKADFEQIVLVGRRVSTYTLTAITDVNPECKVVHFTKTKEALAFLGTNLTGNETVLFKGSQYLEWIVEKLLADSADRSLLARQDSAARRRRASWGLK